MVSNHAVEQVHPLSEATDGRSRILSSRSGQLEKLRLNFQNAAAGAFMPESVQCLSDQYLVSGNKLDQAINV